MNKQNNKFTLIELLVVVAITAILASLLMPALRNARSKATQILCLSNVRQQGVAIMIYMGDYDGAMPLGGMPDHAHYGRTMLHGDYAAGHDNFGAIKEEMIGPPTGALDAWHCPRIVPGENDLMDISMAQLVRLGGGYAPVMPHSWASQGYDYLSADLNMGSYGNQPGFRSFANVQLARNGSDTGWYGTFNIGTGTYYECRSNRISALSYPGKTMLLGEIMPDETTDFEGNPPFQRPVYRGGIVRHNPGGFPEGGNALMADGAGKWVTEPTHFHSQYQAYYIFSPPNP